VGKTETKHKLKKMLEGHLTEELDVISKAQVEINTVRCID